VGIADQAAVWKQAVHTLTVVVADRPYSDPVLIDFTDPEAQFDSLEWTFRVGPGGYCPPGR
jgi:hypothetical protein